MRIWTIKYLGHHWDGYPKIEAMDKADLHCNKIRIGDEVEAVDKSEYDKLLKENADMRAKMAISDNIKKNPEVLERFKAMLKKAIDDYSCFEILEVGFRRGVEWYVFESGFHIAQEMIQEIQLLRVENELLKQSLQRQVKE